MIRLFLLFLGLLLLANISFAQGNLTGRVFENKTRIPLGGVSIQNLKSNSISVSDKNGLFSIRAHVGDLVTFSTFAYRPDTLFVKDLNDIEIFLDLKSTMLKEVKVTGTETRLGNLKAAPTPSPFGGQTLVYQTDENGNPKGGLKLNVFDSHADANKREKAAQLTKDERTHEEITRIFSPEGLKDYIPLTGQEMDNFIILYRPDIATFTSPEFHLTVYINTSYEEFMKIPPNRRKSKDLTDLKSKPN
jgi:hypothetical protein